MQYIIGELINFVTPQAEILFKFDGFAKVKFNFPETIKTILGGREPFTIIVGENYFIEDTARLRITAPQRPDLSAEKIMDSFSRIKNNGKK